MNIYFLLSGILCFLLGISHSFLGEYLIFNSKREKGTLIPSQGGENLKERHLRILWVTWHLASVFGWCIGVMLIKMSISREESIIPYFYIQSITIAMLLASFFVLIGTKGKHPGWVVLLIIGVLLILG